MNPDALEARAEMRVDKDASTRRRCIVSFLYNQKEFVSFLYYSNGIISGNRKLSSNRHRVLHVGELTLELLEEQLGREQHRKAQVGAHFSNFYASLLPSVRVGQNTSVDAAYGSVRSKNVKMSL